MDANRLDIGEVLKEIDQGTVDEALWNKAKKMSCLLYTSPSPRDVEESRMPSSA